MSDTSSHASAGGPEPAIGLHVVVGAGPVGTAVATELLARGRDVRVVTHSSTPHITGVEAVRGDASDSDSVGSFCQGAAVVYGCMNAPYSRWATDLPPMQRGLLDGAGRAGAVYAVVENVYGYGQVSGPMNEALPLTATTRKGSVRAGMCEELTTAHANGRLQTVSVRASDFYGPRVLESAAGERFFPPILAGKNVQVLGDVGALHTQSYVPDIARALVTVAADPDAHGRAWHSPNAPAISQQAFAELTYRLAGTTGKAKATPKIALRAVGLFNPTVRELIEMLYEFENDFVVDSSAYTERYGDSATPLDEGIEATLAWYRSVA